MHGDLKERREGALWPWGRRLPDRGKSGCKGRGEGSPLAWRVSTVSRTRENKGASERGSER